MGKLRIVALIAILFTASSSAVVYAMTSTNYGIEWDSINGGGDDISSSTNYQLRDTIGEQGTGTSTSATYGVSAGYRVGDQSSVTLSFAIHSQENATEIAYTAFSSTTNNTVSVSSISGFSVGDMIGVVENKGLAEKISIGRISALSAGVITVDQWDGSPSLMSAAPLGGNDFVYRMNGSTVPFGTLSSSTPVTSLTATRVSTVAPTGYTVYVHSDGNLRTGSNSIANVSDGTVTSGSEEYGWRVFGATATSTGSDYPFATSTTAIQTNASSTSGLEQRVGLEYKLAVSSSTTAGSYSQLVFYTVTANF